MKHTSYISIGSNLGNRKKNCHIAIDKLDGFSKIINMSSFYETEPWGYDDDNYYINAIIELKTSLCPHDLLNELKNIETLMGREKKKDSLYHARIIDLDILFFDDIILNDNNLIIPHPKLFHRKYVLKPFSEIAPYFVCPCTNKTVLDLFQQLQDDSSVFVINS